MRFPTAAGFAFVMAVLNSSCAGYNSSSQDDALYNEAVLEVGGDPNFAAAYAIIQTQCASCHSHSAWNNLNSNSLWVASGYVIKGQANSSVLIQKTFQNGTGNMPPSNTLSSSDFNTLKTWINNIP
jgi:mono/diheme cytochrome c family protein